MVLTVSRAGIYTHLGAFSYALAEVTSTGNTPAAAGASYVTLRGQNFGFADLSPTVLLGATVCASTRWVSETALVIRATGGIASAAVEVRIGGRSSRCPSCTDVFHSFDVPLIVDVTPPTAAVSGGASITLAGRNFGTSDYSPFASLGASRSGHKCFLCSPFYVKGVSLGYVGRIKT